MNARQKTIGALLVFIVLAQNYESQISHVAREQIAAWGVHEWVGAALNVLLAGALAWKAFLTDSGSTSPKP